MYLRKVLSACCVAIAIVTLISEAWAASSVESFYQGKQLTLIMWTTPGGTNDLLGRLVADHMKKKIPGNPTIIMKGMPGAGGMIATNYLYSVAPKDGTVFGATGRGLAFAPLLGMPNAEFDPLKFTWLGNTAKDTMVGVSWHTSPIKTVGDIFTKELVVGSDAPGSDTSQIPLALNATTGSKFKVIYGYPGGTEILLAIERGELGGRVGWSYDGLLAQKKDWLTEHKINLLFQLALEKDKRLPDVPLAADYAKDPLDRQVLQLITAMYELGRPYLAPPDLPKDRAEALKTAFMATITDKDFLTEAAKGGIVIDAMTGDDFAQIIRKSYASAPEVITRAREVLAQR